MLTNEEFIKLLRHRRFEEIMGTEGYLEKWISLRKKFLLPVKSGIDGRDLDAYLESIYFNWGIEAVSLECKRLIDGGAERDVLGSSIASIFEGKNENEKAMPLLEYLIDLRGGTPVLLFYLGQVAASLSDWQLVRRIAITSLKAQGMGPWVTNQWAELLVAMGQLDIAKEFCARLSSQGSERHDLESRIATFEVESDNFPLPVYLINLDKEARRGKLSTDCLSRSGYRVSRISAFDGSKMSEFERKAVLADPGNSNLSNGAVACALSHIHTWELVVEKDCKHALVVEDDAVPYRHWRDCENLGRIVGSHDLVYINERMSLGFQENSSGDAMSVDDMLGKRKFSKLGVGTDGYIISKRGAEKLLAKFGRDKICGHVDWQVASYCISAGSNNLVESKVRNQVKFHPDDLINAACLRVPLIASFDFRGSHIAA